MLNTTGCPRCSTPDLLPIVFYGEPALELAEVLMGRLMIGGCLGPDSPAERCWNWGQEWGSTLREYAVEEPPDPP